MNTTNMEFAGHGACGVHAKAAWLPCFHVFAIPEAVARKLMPVAGADPACREVVERGSSYVAPLAAYCFLMYLKPRQDFHGAVTKKNLQNKSRNCAN